MKTYSKCLMAYLITSVGVALAIVALFETNILLEGGLCGNAEMEFLITTVMQLVTICMIPLALRLFKTTLVRKYITEKKEKGHFRMALIRMNMLLIPMITDIICYYLFMKVAFAYLAIILAISLVFIIPTKERCNSEL